jgi:hypothetical protein
MTSVIQRFLLASLIVLALSCGTTESSKKPVKPESAPSTPVTEAFAPELAPASEVPLASVEFYTDEVRRLVPVVPLGSRNTVVLRFDLLEPSARTFIVRARPINPDGSASALLPIEYMRGIQEDQIISQKSNAIGQPVYFSYVYRFPNENFSFSHSGAYELSLVDFQSNKTIQTFPFFLSEEAVSGTLAFEEFPGEGSSRRTMLQPFLTVTGATSKFPCQDFMVQFVQDRQFRRSRKRTVCDQSRTPEVRFHLARNDAFESNFEYRFLDLSTYRTQNARVLGVNESFDPPAVRLAVDNPEFTGSTAPDYFPLEGVQRIGNDARYATTEFRLLTGALLKPSDEIFLVGNFNRWALQNADKMVFDEASSEFRVKRLLKEGRYQYSFMVKKENGFQFISTPFTTAQHEYLSLIYQKDPTRPVFRLLGSVSARR